MVGIRKVRFVVPVALTSSPNLVLELFLSSLLMHPRARIREISSAAVTNMMARSDDVKFVLESLPNILSLLQHLVQPSMDEAATINVRSITLFSQHHFEKAVECDF